MKTNHTILVGIDTGVNTGICVYSRTEKKILSLDTVKIHQALTLVKLTHELNAGRLFVRVEDARLRKWVPRQKNESAERGRREGAGSVKRDASVWEDFLTDMEIPFEMVAPKNNATKMKPDFFKKITKWEGKTTSHSRDAAALVIGY